MSNREEGGPISLPQCFGGVIMKDCFKKLLSVCVALLLLGGCSSSEDVSIAAGNENMLRYLNEQPINVSEAVQIYLNTNQKEKNDLLREDFSISSGEMDVEAGTYFEILECTRNKQDIFYTKCYSESMAQFSYYNQVYRYDTEQDKSILLYETANAYWLNELVAADEYIYWVEYIYKIEEESSFYQVMQFDLSTEEVKCIASRNATETGEICTAISEHYMTWYDYYSNDEVVISVFDIKNQELMNIEDEGLRLSAPYERLYVVDDGITYFSEDETGNIYINRYNLSTKEKEVLFLGVKGDFNKLAGCFSNSKFIGWFEEYSVGPYYFFNIDSGVLYCLDPPSGMNVFSAWATSDFLFVNDSQNHCVYVYDFGSKETYYQVIPQKGAGLGIRQYEDGAPYMKVRMKEKTSLLSIQMP